MAYREVFFILPARTRAPGKRKTDLSAQGLSMHSHIYLSSLLVSFTHFKIENVIYAHESIQWYKRLYKEKYIPSHPRLQPLPRDIHY